jgi:hypothetical protein
MTDSVKGAGGPPGPPWSVDVLSDLHAGVLDPAESARLWPRVNADPDARAILAALDEVKVGLGQLGSAPAEPMPAQYAAQLDAAIEAQVRASGRVATATAPPEATELTRPVAPVVDLAAARKRRNRMAAWGAGVLTAAAAAAAIAFVAIPGQQTTGTPNAEDGNAANPPTQTEPPDGSSDAPLALRSDNLAAAIGPLNGKDDYGPLGDEQGLKDCLAAHDVPAGDPVGVSQVTLDGQKGVAALMGAGTEIGKFRLVVVEPTCSADKPGKVLANAEVP